MDPRLALKLRSSFLSPLGTLIMCCIYFTLVCYYSVSFLFMVTKYLTVFSISGNMGPSLNYAFLPLIAVGSQSLASDSKCATQPALVSLFLEC